MFQAKESAPKSAAGEGTSPAAAVKNTSSRTGGDSSSVGSGHSDSASNSTVLTPSQTKKTTPVSKAGRDMSKVELVAELNSRLAKLTDAAAASDVSVQIPTTTKTNGAEVAASSVAPCRAQSMPKATAEREGAAVTKQRSSASSTGTSISQPDITLASYNSKNSGLPQQTRVFSFDLSIGGI